MRRRSRRTATLVALVAVLLFVVTTSPRDPALAADPSLSQAQAQQRALQQQVAAQRAQLDKLKAEAATLGKQLDAAKAALAEVTAEYERVQGLVSQVQDQIAEITAQLEKLRAQIAELDAQLKQIAAEIQRQTQELHARQALLEQHLRDAYEQSQTSLLELLLSAESLDAASTEVGYMLSVSDTDTQLAEEIRQIRAELETKQKTLRDGRAALAEARKAAEEQEAQLKEREAQLKEMSARLAELKKAAEKKRAEQEAALNAVAAKQGDVERALQASISQQSAADALVSRLQAEEAARQKALAEARARAEAQKKYSQLSARGFRWPEAAPRITQEFGPTSFVLEPPYTYNGVYYPHFHTAIDMASGCGTPIMAAATGVVAASGQPLMPWDTGYGVVIDHGGGIQSWYWHLQPRVIVAPGQPVVPGQLIGYEGTTGNSTGCHLHFAINAGGGWVNPRLFLP